MQIIFTNGSISKNPGGIGGWAYVTGKDGKLIVKYGYHENTTSNRMELTAILNAIRDLNIVDVAELYSDSEYCINCINRWMWGWAKSDFKGRKNGDLLMEIYQERKIKPNIAFRWVRGHDGNIMNEIADKYANKARVKKINDTEIIERPVYK